VANVKQTPSAATPAACRIPSRHQHDERAEQIALSHTRQQHLVRVCVDASDMQTVSLTGPHLAVLIHDNLEVIRPDIAIESALDQAWRFLDVTLFFVFFYIA